MRIALASLAASSLVMVGWASAATCQEAAPTPSPTPTPERRICRVQQETGTRFGGGRVCHTRAEWAAIDGMAVDGGDAVGSRSSKQ